MNQIVAILAIAVLMAFTACSGSKVVVQGANGGKSLVYDPKSSQPQVEKVEDRADLREVTALHIEQRIWEMVHLTKDWEDASFRMYQQQDIDGDDVDDTILVTTFEHDNSSYQKLFVCLSSSPRKVMQLDVGCKWDRIAMELAVKDRKITIKGMKYIESDAGCCPSQPYESTFVVMDGKIVQKHKGVSL
jgi:hypothetical protein